MNERVIVSQSDLTAIADAIRSSTGTTSTFNVPELSERAVSLIENWAGVEQETPKISVNPSGLITATAGTKTSTHQLAFQETKTITPSTISQIAVPSGYYTGGDITILGDSNLIADNIKMRC